MYAQAAGLRKRVILPVPVLSPRLSSLWVGLVTPIPADLARPLIDSLVNEVVVHDHAIDEVVPHHPIGCREAIELALRRRWRRRGVHPLDRRRAVRANARRSDLDRSRTGPARPCSLIVKSSTPTRHPKRSSVKSARWAASGDGSSATGYGRCADGSTAWSAVSACGADVAIRPTSVSATSSTSGVSKRSNRRVSLRLRAEMRLPGDAWLEWSITPEPDRRSAVRPACPVPPSRPVRSCVLVCGRTVPPVHLPATRPQHRATGRPGGGVRRPDRIALPHGSSRARPVAAAYVGPHTPDQVERWRGRDPAKLTTASSSPRSPAVTRRRWRRSCDAIVDRCSRSPAGSSVTATAPRRSPRRCSCGCGNGRHGSTRERGSLRAFLLAITHGRALDVDAIR